MPQELTAQALIERYQLIPHPEGGWYRELHRSGKGIGVPQGYPGERVALTAIYFLLQAGEFSALHTVRGEEVWIHLAGGPLELVLVDPHVQRLTLAAPGEEGAPLLVVSPNVLQGARPLAGFTMVSCLVAPGFDFADFEIPSREELLERYPQIGDAISLSK